MKTWITRQRYFIEFTLSGLIRQKWKNFSLLFVYTLMVFILASVIFFAQAVRNEAETTLAGAPQLVVQKLVAGRHGLIEGTRAAKIREIRGVQSARPRLWGYYYHPLVQANFTIMASEDFQLENGQAAVGEGVARILDTGKGGSISLTAFDGKPRMVEVAQIFSHESALLSSDLVVVTEPFFRDLFHFPAGFATDIAVEIRNPREFLTIARKIIKKFPDTRPVLKKEILSTYKSLFHWRSGMALVLFAGAVCAFFVFAWDKATGLSATEKTEVGILKALGWDTSDILMMKFWEGTVISLTAFVLGIVLAYVHVFFAQGVIIASAIKGWSVLYPDFHPAPVLDAYQLAQLFFLTVLPYTFLTIVPAWKVAISDPDMVMR